jgi:hypothetical protein
MATTRTTRHMSDYDWYELLLFASVVDAHGLHFAFERQRPEFQNADLQEQTGDRNRLLKLLSGFIDEVARWWKDHQADGHDLLAAHATARQASTMVGSAR